MAATTSGTRSSSMASSSSACSFGSNSSMMSATVLSSKESKTIERSDWLISLRIWARSAVWSFASLSIWTLSCRLVAV